MCGICGIQHKDTSREVDASVVRGMNDALVHRGPDDEGVWAGGHVVLAARRLSIMDVELGHQPMSNEDESWAVAFNGELYNAADLRKDLQGKGYAFNTTCDTEVVLRSYEAYGAKAVERFNGMFAIAAYDRREDCLTLVRDRLGIKPLYYTEANGALAFASELNALTRSGMVSGKLNRQAMTAYFQNLYIPAPDTIFDGVYKLRPGEMVRYRGGVVESERYWAPEYSVDDSWTMESASERFMELFEDSIGLQKASDVPLGAFLSGGLDSSSVVAMLAGASTQKIKTFSIGFDDEEANELKYAREVAECFGTDHTEEMLRPDVVGLAESFPAHFGEPFADSSAIPMWIVSKLARKSVTVSLSGDGGDELFAGYTWLHRNLQVARYRRIPRPLRMLAGSGLSFAAETPFVRKLRRFHGDGNRSFMDSFRRREQCFDRTFLEDLFLPSVVDGLASDWNARYAEHVEASAGLSGENRMLYQDTVMYLPEDILTKVDRMSMANSLEARVPFLDHRIVEFAATLPFHLKYSGGVSKRVLKHAMQGILPESSLRQRKRGFSIPIHRWFREDLNDYFQDAVLTQDSRCQDFLDMSEVKRLVDVHQGGSENYGHHLWVLLMFEQWLGYASKLPGVSLSL